MILENLIKNQKLVLILLIYKPLILENFYLSIFQNGKFVEIKKKQNNCKILNS
jgi:hypothetical protein